MDSVDSRILGLLRENSRASNVELAKRLGLSEGAVRKRVENLVSEKTIAKFTIITGAGAGGIVAIKCDIKTPTQEVVKKLKALGASMVSEVSGEYDVICHVDTNGMEELNSVIEKIRTMPGVMEAKLFTVLKQD
ncbi:MAG TPA: Lrp/AsnC family transcriptional regulator [archaeon]|nr:Lrp/AsnC family transcriptional regulator [archaeon]HLD80848.1 Lrp/AsnC family transcriptional regulator [archaeon]